MEEASTDTVYAKDDCETLGFWSGVHAVKDIRYLRAILYLRSEPKSVNNFSSPYSPTLENNCLLKGIHLPSLDSLEDCQPSKAERLKDREIYFSEPQVFPKVR